jgi:WhiB family redox-sensing transcriptional regulator
VTDWREQAACRGMNPNWWYPHTSDSLTAAGYTICRRCPVRQECLEYALANDEPGIWGGVSHRRRMKMTRGRVAS